MEAWGATPMFRTMQAEYMCDMNIVQTLYYYGGTQVAITRDIDNTRRTTRHMAEVQRDSYEALAENLATAQRRSMGLAEGGLEFMRLQEENARATQEWFAGGVRLLKLQQRNAEFVQGWSGDAVETVREQTEQNVRTVQTFARSASKQQESFRALTRVGGNLQGILLPLRIRPAERENLPASRPAGLGGN